MIASPFQAATTLSSRSGRTRSARAASSRAGPTPTARVVRLLAQLQRRAAVLEGAALGDRQQGGRPGAVVGTEHLDQLRRGPDVEGALRPLGVGVQRGGERALVGQQLGEQEARDPAGHLAGLRRRRTARPSARRPTAAARCRRASSRSAAPPRRGRRRSARTRRPAGRGSRRPPSRRASSRPSASPRPPDAVRHPQQELEHHRRRELRRGAEPAPLRVEVALQRRHRRVERGLVEGDPAGRARPTAVSASLIRVAEADTSSARLVHASSIAVEQLGEARLTVPRLVREVGAGEERAALVVEHARHRPAALPGQRDGRLHVDRVDVGPLLAVDLDADVVLVQVRRGRLVLERLVRHHVAPVARGVPDAQQHRHVALTRLREGLRATTPTSRPGCPCAGGGTARSRSPGGWARGSPCLTGSCDGEVSADDPSCPTSPDPVGRGLAAGLSRVRARACRSR